MGSDPWVGGGWGRGYKKGLPLHLYSAGSGVLQCHPLEKHHVWSARHLLLLQLHVHDQEAVMPETSDTFHAMHGPPAQQAYISTTDNMDATQSG